MRFTQEQLVRLIELLYSLLSVESIDSGMQEQLASAIHRLLR